MKWTKELSEIAKGAFFGAAMYATGVYFDDHEKYQKSLGVNAEQAMKIEEKSDRSVGLVAGLAYAFIGVAFERGRRRGKKQADDENDRIRDKIWDLSDLDFSRSFEVMREDDARKENPEISTMVYLPGSGVFIDALEGAAPVRFGGSGLFIKFPGKSKEQLLATPISQLRDTTGAVEMVRHDIYHKIYVRVNDGPGEFIRYRDMAQERKFPSPYL